MSTLVSPSAQPLSNLEDWDDFLEGRYKEGKSDAEFRQ
jgi:inositol oxygenase